MKMEKLNGELRKFTFLGRKILTLQIDPLLCEHPLKSSVPFRSGPFRSVPFSCERGLSIQSRNAELFSKKNFVSEKRESFVIMVTHPALRVIDS